MKKSKISNKSKPELENLKWDKEIKNNVMKRKRKLINKKEWREESYREEYKKLNKRKIRDKYKLDNVIEIINKYYMKKLLCIVFKKAIIRHKMFTSNKKRKNWLKYDKSISQYQKMILSSIYCNFKKQNN